MTEAERERAAVVRWLRKVAQNRRDHASDCFLRFDDEAGDVAVNAAEAHDFAADFIERGDHIREERR